MEIGEKVISDDYCAIGTITLIDNKLFVIGDFGSIEYDDYADWRKYE